MRAAAFSQLLNIFKINVAALRTSVTNAAALGQLLKLFNINVAALSHLPRHYSRLSAAALALRAATLGNRPKREFSHFLTKNSQQRVNYNLNISTHSHARYKHSNT